MSAPDLQRFAVPFGTILVSSLGFTSQYLFNHIEPGPLRKGDAYILDALTICTLICFWRTCYTDPGRVPKDWQEQAVATVDGKPYELPIQRWCRKCEAYKPPRAHHCKTCKRCIAKMDHHCVWTANCVSHITFPHFIRFISYGVAAVIYLGYFLFQRCAVLWQHRHLPSYLGPNIYQLTHLFLLVVANSVLFVVLGLLLGRHLWQVALNMTTIEGWEIKRHETLLRRARVLGGYLNGPDGSRVRIEHQEFPWDVGIWSNLCQAMDSKIPLLWLWPFAASPTIESGLRFVHNGIDDPSKPWPPPDPDRMFRAPRTQTSGNGFTQSMDVDEFRKRQAADQTRYADVDGEYIVRRKPFHERLEDIAKAGNVVYDNDDVAVETDEDGSDDSGDEQNHIEKEAGEEGWRDKEGQQLADFGVDEVAEFYDEDDLPLAELMRRRRAEQ